MQYLETGEFFGETNRTLRLDGVTLTDTEYTVDRVDWHYHENAYFTFLLAGRLVEGNRKETYNCSSGTLLFHNWQEPHYNIKPRGFARGFHVELHRNWLDTFSLDPTPLSGTLRIDDPGVRILFHRLYRESRIADRDSEIAIQAILLNLHDRLYFQPRTRCPRVPPWAQRIREILHDTSSESVTLRGLSELLGVHPVHISRDFPKHFHCAFGEYLRRIRIERSMCLLYDKKLSLTDISGECGFADQSHFIRCFKKLTGMVPSEYRKRILR